ncbi:MAG: hypothetical protein NWF10_02015 [Candidatus Bathyarchaeota archaeon]|nr:hypothetical protein [Candidatus Bathyarchaeota archaeon]
MLGVTKTDRIMWFSMWFLASIASFGIAFFPMFYLMIKRRNKHFHRHIEHEKKISDKIDGKTDSTILDLLPERNAKLWTISLLLIFPIFIITYLLTKDLIVHEKNQQKTYSKIFPEKKYMTHKVSLKKYSLITLLTLGIGLIYWLYKTVNMYNTHFIEQEKSEEEISKL